eukprot:TRINITY_DN716_c0_g1_i2.p1 TRINITY_DN716_c0_g1~~TRINITY_DN716_c0_g1_i2.p1  ORF type:complete len:350 (-),score=67.53 TRINITY_DN716_c0_g1_i2:156-1097(-)
MGQANVNLGVVGVDWNSQGGGFTLFGARIGGSAGRGLEVGVNPGLGVKVNGQGFHAGASASVGIRDGVSAAAGAAATWADESAGAAAVAIAHVSGSRADAAAGLRSTERDARSDAQSRKAFLEDKKEELSAARRDEDNAKTALFKQQTLVANIKEEVQSLQEQKVAAGEAVVNHQKMLAALSKTMLCAEKELARVIDDLDFALTPDETNQLTLSKSEKQALVTSLEGKLRKAEGEVGDLEERLKDANARWSREHRSLLDKQKDQEHKQEAVQACQTRVHEAAAAHEAAERMHRDAAQRLQEAEGTNRLIDQVS